MRVTWRIVVTTVQVVLQQFMWCYHNVSYEGYMKDGCYNSSGSVTISVSYKGYMNDACYNSSGGVTIA